MRGTLDRIENGTTAVILLEDVQKELSISLHALPAGSEVGAWFRIDLWQGEIVSIELDRSAEQHQQERVDSVLAKLRSRSATSRFKRK
ncbi:DUF3006 family protein [Planomicrobium sp. YIM 101495]|nr:DUF3006 family protein [Planomicrobium sp. YIM 101495]